MASCEHSAVVLSDTKLQLAIISDHTAHVLKSSKCSPWMQKTIACGVGGRQLITLMALSYVWSRGVGASSVVTVRPKGLL